MNGEETRFKIGNKDSEKWTEEEANSVFKEILERAVDNEYYSIQETILESRDLIPYSTFFYLINKFPDLDNYKKELNAIVISRVNKGAITNELNSTACIWRMKQLGETDRTEVRQTVITEQPLFGDE